MRSLILLAFVGLALSGCLSDDETGDDSMDVIEPETTVDVPAPLTASGLQPAGLDPFNIATGNPCSQPVSTCEKIPFSIDGNFTVDAILTWTNPANDLDLYLYKADGTQLSMEGINQLGDMPNTEHDMPAYKLTAGDYEFWIAFWNAAAANWEFEATFAE